MIKATDRKLVVGLDVYLSEYKERLRSGKRKMLEITRRVIVFN